LNQVILKSFNGDTLSASVFESKYALKDEEGNLKEFSYEDTKKRLNGAMKEINKNHNEEKYLDFLDRFMFGGRTTYGLGNIYDKTCTFSNCYYIPIKGDSIEDIFETAKEQARIFSKGGGVGIDISNLRPNTFKVNNSAKTTSGAVSFMDLYSLTTGLIGQHGRRGATMISIEISHPDSEEFIGIKGGKDKNKVQYANISVKVDDEFMKAVENDTQFMLRWEGKEIKTVSARYLFNKLVESNYQGAEPGILYWDNIINNEPAGVFPESRPRGVNPCGELPLADYGNCTLGSLNLSKYIINPFKPDVYFDYNLFKEDVYLAIESLDNIVELNLGRHPLEQNNIKSKNERKIGLGIMGLGDCLVKLNLKYGSEESLVFLHQLGLELKRNSILSSLELAKERGMCELLLTKKRKEYAEYVKYFKHEYFTNGDFTQYELDEMMIHGVRNIGWTTIAPTGSIGIIQQCTSGLEPIFKLSYERTVINGEGGKKTKFIVYHPLVKEYDDIYGEGSHLKNKNFITAEDIYWEDRVKVQSVLQKYISASISSTCNLPNDVSREVISNIYITAWKMKLKGITIYRDGCREGVLNKVQKYDVLADTKFPESGDAFYEVCRSDKQNSKDKKKWYLFWTIDNDTKLPNSFFIKTNYNVSRIQTEEVLESLNILAKKYIKEDYLKHLEEKTSHQANYIKIARYLGLLLRHRIPIVEIYETIDALNPLYTSLIYHVKKILARYLEGTESSEKCPECGEKLSFEGGCKGCKHCGFQKCG